MRQAVVAGRDSDETDADSLVVDTSAHIHRKVRSPRQALPMALYRAQRTSLASGLLETLDNISQGLETASAFSAAEVPLETGIVVPAATDAPLKAGAVPEHALHVHDIPVPAADHADVEPGVGMVEDNAEHESDEPDSLDAVAGNLLELKEAVVLHSLSMQSANAVPDFDALDEKHEGSLNLEQFTAHAKSPTIGEDVFKKIDKDASGKIDQEEYDKAVQDGIVTVDVIDASPTSEKAGSIICRTHALAFFVSLPAWLSNMV
jgi:hypothetical protein